MPDLSSFVEREIGSLVTDFEIAGTRVSPSGFERKEEERNRAGHFGHDFAEGFGRLTHGPENDAGEGDVDDSNE